MIDEVYRDTGTVMKDGAEVPFVNGAHEWWVRFTTGAIRPATETEVELWQLAMGYKDNFTGACKNYWDTYCAGTGKTIETFDGVAGKTPEDEVRAHRLNLEQQVQDMRPIYWAATQVKASDGSYTTEIAGVRISKLPIA